MKYHKQLIASDPERGIWGDCFRTAVACLLDLEPLMVPHFFEDTASDMDSDKWDVSQAIDEWINSWLVERGYVRIRFPAGRDDGQRMKLEDALTACAVFTDSQLHYMISGTAPDGQQHVLIAKGNKVVWDPSPIDCGLIGPIKESNIYIIEIIVKAESQSEAISQLEPHGFSRTLAQSAGFTGDVCPNCKSLSMVRTGTCSTCQACGTNTGCS